MVNAIILKNMVLIGLAQKNHVAIVLIGMIKIFIVIRAVKAWVGLVDVSKTNFHKKNATLHNKQIFFVAIFKTKCYICYVIEIICF